MDKDLLFEKRMKDLASRAYNRDIVLYTDFLNLDELHKIHSLISGSLPVTVCTFGGYDLAERQMAAFLPDALSYLMEEILSYPIVCLKIQPLSLRFSEKLSHRDYLGALLNLGLERSMLGDLLIDETGAYCFCKETMAGFIQDNLTRVRHTAVLTVQVMEMEELPQPKFREIQGTVPSIRLDVLIALAFGESRSRITPFIEGGKVFVNGRQITSNGYTPREKDLISVRQKGRFIYEQILTQTKKGRYRVSVKRYL